MPPFPPARQRLYLSVITLTDAASGIIEAPVMGVSTANISARQQGRLRTSSVIDCATDRRAITTARALDPRLPRRHRRHAPYGDGNASRRIVAKSLRTGPAGLHGKAFYDLPPMAAP